MHPCIWGAKVAYSTKLELLRDLNFDGGPKEKKKTPLVQRSRATPARRERDGSADWIRGPQASHIKRTSIKTDQHLEDLTCGCPEAWRILEK